MSTSARAKRVLRSAATLAALLVGACFALLLAIRLVVLPQAETRHGDIAAWLGARIGAPVEIDGVVTGWDGWNPKLSVRGLRILGRDAQRGVLLELPRVDLLIAWTSLAVVDLRLKELLIEGPRLSLRRDTAGRLHVAGIEGQAEPAVDDTTFADWLMRQPQVIVHDALVAWNDEYRQAPQLLLDHVSFRLERQFGRHLAALTGVPPAELASPVELRADLSGHSLRDWTNLQGRIYLRLDYADVAAWREWLPLPVHVDNGIGAARIWMDVAQSRPVDVTADLELEDVRTTLGDGLAPLALVHVAGRVHWKRSDSRTDVAVRHLTFTAHDGAVLAPADAEGTLVGDAAAGGTFRFAQIELRPLVAVAPNVPLPERLRRDIARYDPRGTLANGAVEWSGSADAPSKFAASSDLRNVSLAAVDASPGVGNVSGRIEMTERSGHLRIDSQSASITLPRVFAEPLAFDSLRGDVRWEHDDAASSVQFTDVAFANGDVAGNVAGRWKHRAGAPVDTDVKAQLARANLAAVHRYIPTGAGAGVKEWLRKALVKGTAADGSLLLAGDLAHFPFADGKGGQFVLAARARDATLQYAERWPAISDIAADVRIDGSKLTIAATTGRVLGAQIGPTRAEIADFHDPRPVLHIDGTASGPTQEFLAFVAQTPVSEWTGHLTEGAAADGDGQLALKFDLPLREMGGVKISGDYRMTSNAVRLRGVPALTAVSGALSFTEHDVRATNIAAEALGGPAKLDVASENGRVRVSGAGTADLQRVRAEYDLPFFERITGMTDWQLSVDARGQQVEWLVQSSLDGASIDLPVPLRKVSSSKVPLRVERRELRAGEDRIAIDYGTALRMVLHRRLGAPINVDRVLVLLGNAATESVDAEQPGLWIRGDVPAIDLDAWLALDARSGAQAAAASPSANVAGNALTLNGVDLSAASLDVLGRKFTRLRSTARRQGSDWRLTLDGNEVAGTAVWRGVSAAQPNGRIVARLARLTTPAAAGTGAAANADAQVTPGANRWPEVDITAETLRSKERALGRLELLAHPAGSDWQIQKLALVNDAGRIDAEGSWRNVSSRSQTRLNVTVDVKEAGQFLGRFGWPNAVKSAPTRIEGQLAWDGAPSDFDYPSLSGTFTLRSAAGQFTKVDPGVGRLLGILSLQALPRRISLDFRDVFSEGFAFDSITADVRIRNGLMHTDDFRLVGPAAAVNIAGDVDLAHETQQLKVRVQPSLSSGVSAGAAALFIANPLIGAAVGAGTLLAQKMLNNPFDQLFSYEYAVSGSWEDPVVTKSGNAASTAQSGATIR
jgi:uncharacterized protein (TIGR02099 family)